MRKIAIIILFFFINSLIFSADDAYKDLIPEEYDKSEFPQGLRDLRRAEIILVGSYPFSLLFTKIGMDVYDYASNGFDSKYAPSLFGGSSNIDRTSSDPEKVLLTALCVSAGVVLIDFIIGKVKKGKSQSANKQTVKYRESGAAGNQNR